MESMQSLEQCPALVLNADYRPLSYFPLSLWSWQDAVKAVFRETVTVLSEYEREVHSPGTAFKLPSVLVLKEFVPAVEKPAFTRFNVFLRDGWQCQYCGADQKTHELTFDHVVPKSRGGKTSWTNIVAACRSCNTCKGHKLLHECGMRLKAEPVRPSMFDLQRNGRKFPPNFLHESWGDFLYWDSELDHEEEAAVQ
ncbi:MAG: HNH endonuclease [Rhodospirillales bacterium]|nr:HNH endonuclease [Alphaproteobacteria bacterium]USO03011.1 MAG: HNH endonuclease [Rhodospirillales bacterium]